jgi:Tfp pilus assembly protein PilX
MRNIFKKVESIKYRVERKGKSHRLSTSRGYTLLFAMIVASIVLALGVSLLTISRKEFALSSSATQSTNAFYAADSGIGCAEYWDNNGAFSTSTFVLGTQVQCSYNFIINTPASSTVTMAPTPGDVSGQDCSNASCTFTFYAPFSTDGTSNKSCAYVTIDKHYAPNLVVSDPTYRYTTITSRGYNIGYNPTPASGPDCSSPSPKKVERAIQVTY